VASAMERSSPLWKSGIEARLSPTTPRAEEPRLMTLNEAQKILAEVGQLLDDGDPGGSRSRSL